MPTVLSRILKLLLILQIFFFMLQGLYLSCVLVVSYVLSAVLAILLELPLVNLKELVIGKPPAPITV